MNRKELLAAIVLVFLPRVTSAQLGAEFNSCKIHFELDSAQDYGKAIITADSLGVGLSTLLVYAPGNRLVASYDAGSKSSLGGGILRFESPKPFIADLHAMFPEGQYKFVGVTFEGDTMEGFWYLDHACPPAPELRLGADDPIIEGSLKTAAGMRIAWTEVEDAVAYDVRVVENTTGATLSVRVWAPRTSFTIPADWLQAGADYSLMVGSVSARDTVNFSHGSFSYSDF